jgi:hypothetical protein
VNMICSWNESRPGKRGNRMATESLRNEVWPHAVIAAILAMAAATLDWSREWLSPHYQFSVRIAAILMIGALVFAVTFLIAGIIERSRRRLEATLRIPLKRMGDVDGHWIDAVWEAVGGEWRLHGGSAFTVESIHGEGFKVSGEFYDVRNLQTPAGDFFGTGYGYDDDGFIYAYKGHEGPTTHHGVGYYDFHRSKLDAEAVTFDGRFLVREPNAVRRVNGRKVRQAELGGFYQDNGRSLLQAYLDSAQPPGTPPGAGSGHREAQAGAAHAEHDDAGQQRGSGGAGDHAAIGDPAGDAVRQQHEAGSPR